MILVAYIRDLQREGLGLFEATEKGTRLRLRAVLMTALTDGIGFLPMALSGSAGAEVQRPLATVVIGGLVTATLLTLFVLPVVYSWKQQEDKDQRRGNGSPAATWLFLDSRTAHPRSESNREEAPLFPSPAFGRPPRTQPSHDRAR